MGAYNGEIKVVSLAYSKILFQLKGHFGIMLLNQIKLFTLLQYTVERQI
jgi:hypothetical protein